jgi:hypothetical protein
LITAQEVAGLNPAEVTRLKPCRFSIGLLFYHQEWFI